jgi:predicted RNase H-like HicB family nuclease
MRSIIQFTIRAEDNTYIAEGVDVAVVTHAETLDALMKNIEEAVALHFEDENPASLQFTDKPSILVNYELPQYA